MTEREELLEEAKALGLSFAKNAKTETIRAAVEQAKSEAADEEALVEAGGSEPQKAPTEAEIRAQLEAEYKEKLEAEKRKLAANMEVSAQMRGKDRAEELVSVGQAKLKARKEALAMKRVIVTVKDPMKQNWEGEIITVSNDIIGDVKKYVPYNLDSGYYLPMCIINMLKDRECTVFVNKRGRDGKYVQSAKTIKAHSIEFLPDLTQEELDELAREQAARMATAD